MKTHIAKKAFTLMTNQVNNIHTLLSDKENETGDVPGWVLVTLMTAGLVTMIWALADQALRDWFQQAITSVVTPS